MSATTIDQLQQAWPDWNIWKTTSMWCATRRGSAPEIPEGFFSRHGEPAKTLLEDDLPALSTALEKQAAVAEAILHANGRPIGPTCPLTCLKLAASTEQTLLAHWGGLGKEHASIGALLALIEGGRLGDVDGLAAAQAVEVRERLEELGLEAPS